MSTPQTDEQRAREPYVAQAAVLMSQCIQDDDVLVGKAVRLIAQALADQAAAIHARYEKVTSAATVLDVTLSDYMLGWVKGDLVAKQQRAVREAIREVSR